VKAWAHTIQRIRTTVPGITGNTKVSEYFFDGAKGEFDSGNVRIAIRSVVALIGFEVLGFTKDDVGLHSLRSGGAMSMFLSGVSEIIIQRVGRWESFAFMDYIREQVEIFTYGVSTKMLESEEFFHVSGNHNHYDDYVCEEEEKPEKPTCDGDGKSIRIPFSMQYNKKLFTKKKAVAKTKVGKL